MFYAEGLAACAQQQTYSYSGQGYSYTSTTNDTYQRSWKYDPEASIYTVDATYVYNYSPQTGSTSTYNSTSSYPYYYAYYSGYGVYDYTTYTYSPFQIKPLATKCNISSAQSLSSGGCLVCMGDGSVRLVSNNVSIQTWQAAGSPASGDILGSDW
jgi:hypothetical protein